MFLNRLIAPLTCGKRKSRKPASRRRQPVRLAVQTLEARQLMSVAPLTAPPAYSIAATASVAPVSQAPLAPAAVSMASALSDAAVAAAMTDMGVTPQVMEAMEAVRMGRPTDVQRALVFVNNGGINHARLNGWITDAHYQAAQADYKYLAVNLARPAVRDMGGELHVQVAKKTIFSPGTDLDLLIKIKSHDPVGDVRSIQRMYNTNVNNWLDSMLGTQRARALYQSNWHNRLDVDFMVDPKYVTEKQFQEIAKLNNAAYELRLAADAERILRSPVLEKITDAHVRDYAVQMQSLIQKRQGFMDALRADPAKLKNPVFAAELHLLMAQEQKYIASMESMNQAWRKQEGLPIAKLPYSEPHYEFKINAKGDVVVTYRTSETIAARGAVRASTNFRTTGTASYLAPVTAQRAVSQLAESMIESNLKRFRDGRPMAQVGRDLAQMTSSLPLSEKGRLLETVNQRFGKVVVTEVVKGFRQEAAANITPGNSMDKMLKNVLRLSDDLSGMNDLRRSFNEYAAKSLKILGAVGNIALIASAVTDFKAILTYRSEALNPRLSDAEADKLFHKAMNASQAMIVTGSLGLLFNTVPTLGAIAGGWTLGYTGGRFILENTDLGQWIDRTADNFAERFVKSYDAAVDGLTELLGGTTQGMVQQDQLFALEAKLIKLLREGKVTLKEGMTHLDVLATIRKGDLWGLDQLIQVKGTVPVDVVTYPTSMLDPKVLPRLDKQQLGGTLAVNATHYYKISLNAGDRISVMLENPEAPGRKVYPYINGMAPNSFRDYSLDNGSGQYHWLSGGPSSPGTTRYFVSMTADKNGEYQISVTDDGLYVKSNPSPCAYTLTVTLNGANLPAAPATPLVTGGDWYDETTRLNRMTAGQAAQEILKYDWKGRIERLDLMYAQRASEVIWNYNWKDLIATLDRMSAERVAEVIAKYSLTNRIATLDRMTAKRASEVILGNNTWTDRIASLDKMSAKRVSEVIWNYNWSDLIATLDKMTSKRASEVIWNYDWKKLTTTLDHMSSKRASEVIWNYNATNRTATLDHMSSKRASEVIWNYDWKKLTTTLDHMTAKRASEVIWNYDWKKLTAALDHMTVARAAAVIKQYTPTVRTDVLNHLSPDRRSQISKLL